MNYELIRALQYAEQLSTELNRLIRLEKEMLPEMLSGELLRFFQDATDAAESVTKQVHNKVLTLQMQEMTALE
ncbi:MAG: hypothetical protein IJG45_02865 [Oscillospiraceae bacterium]|nr:hypothetical protein [Oscillospiraceae bacterium]